MLCSVFILLLRMILSLAGGTLLQTNGGLELAPLCHVSYTPQSQGVTHSAEDELRGTEAAGTR